MFNLGEQIFDAEFLKKLDTIVINVRMMMNAGSGGNRKSRSKAALWSFPISGSTPGDDFRRIDWNAYGRFDRLFVKLFMEEREATVNILLTAAGPCISVSLKSLSALKLSGVMAYLALNNLDRVCLNSLNGTLIKHTPL